MTKDVLVSLSGIHIEAMGKEESEDEAVEVITPANYFCKNGKHYVLYDEVAEGMPGVTKNKIKITGDQSLEMIKSGLTSTHMVFERGKKYYTDYDTPFGKLVMGIYTTDFQLQEEEDRIYAEICYELEVSDELIAECTIRIDIRSKTSGIGR